MLYNNNIREVFIMKITIDTEESGLFHPYGGMYKYYTGSDSEDTSIWHLSFILGMCIDEFRVL